MVMMGLLLPVQRRVCDFLCVGEGGRLPSDGKGLPKHRKQQKNEGKPATHLASLSDAAGPIFQSPQASRGRRLASQACRISKQPVLGLPWLAVPMARVVENRKRHQCLQQFVLYRVR
ncbi:hypothetical protein D3C87_1542670 [compost metagenome]